MKKRIAIVKLEVSLIRKLFRLPPEIEIVDVRNSERYGEWELVLEQITDSNNCHIPEIEEGYVIPQVSIVHEHKTIIK